MSLKTQGKRAFVLSLIVVTMSKVDVAHAQVDVVELTAKEIAEGYARGAFTAVEVTQAFLDRIEKFEPNYNAFISFAPDALATAAALDEELMMSGPRSPLHGVPIVIKEAMDVVGLPSTGAFHAFSSQADGIDLIPAQDATVVARLRDAGAIILGKTNIPRFSFTDLKGTSDSWAGPTFNVYDRALAPGASSAGTATAVSGSFAVLGMAEESAGSIQNPASAQNLVGIKPTFGLVPNTGVMPLGGSTRDVLGPHAKTVYDAAITLNAIAGHSEEDPKTVAALNQIPDGGYTSQLSTSALQGRRIGLFGSGWRNVELDSEVHEQSKANFAPARCRLGLRAERRGPQRRRLHR